MARPRLSFHLRMGPLSSDAPPALPVSHHGQSPFGGSPHISGALYLFIHLLMSSGAAYLILILPITK